MGEILVDFFSWRILKGIIWKENGFGREDKEEIGGKRVKCIRQGQK
jgi:hypothetical protein